MTLNCPCLVIVFFCYWKYGKAPFNCLQYDTQTVLSCYCFVLLLEYGKANRSIVSNTTLKLSLSCYLFSFAFGNTVKQPFNCLQYDTQTVLVLLLFCFAIEKYSKATFQLSTNDTQTVLGLVIVFLLLKYSKATVQLSPCDTQTVLVLLLFVFAIGNTVRQPFNCLQYDTQTVLLLLLFCFCYWKYSKATVQLSPIWHSNCPCVVICFVLLLEIQ